MKDGGKVAVDVNGVAYYVSLSMNSYAAMPAVGECTELFTYLAVKEDALSLFGFTTLDERALFLLLNTVSKIGPKLALTILGSIGAGELAGAVVGGDLDRLSRLPGIGRKTAERIVLELKDKMKPYEGIMVATPVQRSVHDDVISALCNLGYKPADADRIVHSLKGDDFNAILKQALARLNG